MKGFIKTWFQRIWGKVSVDNLVVCQRCRSLWSTCTSDALPHRWRNRYRAVTRKEESWRLDPVQRRSCPGLRCLKVFLWTPRRFLFFLRAVVQPSFLLRVVYKAVLVARAANRRRDDVREMPYLPRDAHVDPAGVNTALSSLHSTAIVELVAARMQCLLLPPETSIVWTCVTMQRCTCKLFLCWTTVPPLHFLSRSYPNLNFLWGSLYLINDLAMVQVFVTRLFGF